LFVFIRGYVLALVAVAAGFFLRQALTGLVGPGLATYITFYPAVMVAALLGGLGPGLVATAVTALVVDYWILPPKGLFRFESAVDIAGQALFSGMGVFMSVVAELYRRGRQKAAAYDKEMALRESHEELQAVLDAAPAAVWIAHDVQARCITGNAYADKLLRAPRGSNISRSAGPGQAAVAYRVFRKGVELDASELPAQVACATGKPVVQEELVLVFPDGRQLDLVAGAVPLFDWRGRVRGSVMAGVDVTALKRVEEALRQSNEGLTQAVRVAGLGTFEHDHRSDRIEYSPLLRQMLGFSEGAEMTIAGTLEKLVAEDQKTMAESIGRAHDPAGDGMFEVECRVARRDGRIRWLSARSRTLFEGEGRERRAVRTIGAVLDVTKRKEFQAELERLVAERTAKLQELVGDLEHFSYTLIHDMRAPLRAMRGYAEIMSNECAGCTKDPIAFLDRIMMSAERMDALITDSLNFTNAVRQELTVEPVDVSALLRGMLDSYPELQPSKGNIQIEGEIPVVMGNQAGLTQCFSNLLGNAMKFVVPGQVPEVRIRAEQREGWVRLWFEDNGIGIPPQALGRVFDMFHRVHRNYEGTGIGLALVRKVTQRMGGRVGVESQLGKGSRFWMELRAFDASTRNLPVRVKSALQTGSASRGTEADHR
jgi:PAS domain S-box-containing protein